MNAQGQNASVKRDVESRPRERDRIDENVGVTIAALEAKIADLRRLASFPLLNPNPVLEVDMEGNIVFMNDAANDVLNNYHLAGSGELFLPSDIDEILRTFREGEAKEVSRTVSVHGRIFEERIHFSPEFMSARIYAHDVTERQKLAEEIKQTDALLRWERDFNSAILSTVAALVIVLDGEGRIKRFNTACEHLTGYMEEEVREKVFWDFLLLPEEMEKVQSIFYELKTGRFPNTCENFWIAKNGMRHRISWINTVLLDAQGAIEFIVGTGIDVTRQRQVEDSLRHSLAEAQQRQREITALLRASRAILEHTTFTDAAAAIFHACKDIVGAMSGYIAMVSKDGTKNEVIYLDTGDFACTVDPNLPMPIRGMRGEAYRSQETFYHNDFSKTDWANLLPEGHVRLDNVLMSPMIVEKKVVGLFGLGNKSGGFTEDDVRIANAFSELAAIALVQKRAEEALRAAHVFFCEAKERLEYQVRKRTEELTEAYRSVERERQRLFSVLEQLPGYVCLLTDDHKFTYVNQEFKKRFGSPGERRCYEYLFGRQDPCENCRTFKTLSEQKAQHWEWNGPDGQTYAIFDYPYIDIDGSLQILELGIDISERKKMEVELKESREKLRNLYAHHQAMIEVERKNIAREIHDEFGTFLTALNIDLTWVEKKLPPDEDALLERIRKDRELIDSAVKLVRKISSDLRPAVLEYLGFPSAVEWLVTEFARRTGIDWSISVDEQCALLDKERSIALFRILQEALTNIARHAAATAIKIASKVVDGNVTVEIIDNGKGAKEGDFFKKESYGILGMKERVEYLGGSLEIRSFPGEGTTVTVIIPLRDDAAK